ncbi:MAG: NADAR family protein [Acidimicrobiales bacterium]
MTPDERLAELVAAEAEGVLPELLLFWGHQPTATGEPGPGCLSQWWPAPFTVDGVRYRTAEHWMMAGKARLFGDEDSLESVLKAQNPGKAKAVGREVEGFHEPTWAVHCYDLVVAGNLAKFGQHHQLRDYLLSTWDLVLVEASPYDRVWGIGLAESDEAARTPSRWRGRNLLGFALMDIRDRLSRSG